MQETIEWYLSFSEIEDSAELSRKARMFLDSVKSLDLSRNQLTCASAMASLLLPHADLLF